MCFVSFYSTPYKFAYFFVSVISLMMLTSTEEAKCQNISFKHITVEDGLSQNTVTSIHQDSLGYLWFSTRNGLSRYDGYDIKVFESKKNDSLTLSGNSINCLANGERGNFWIGTTRGLSEWIHTQGHFNRMDRYFENDSLKGIYDIGNIFTDSKGGVWLLAESKGFHVFYKMKTEKLFKKKLSLKNLPGQNGGFYGQIKEDPAGNIWIGTSRRGLWMWNKKSNEFVPVLIEINGHSPITALLFDSRGDFWVGTLTGLFKRKAGDNHFKKVNGLNNTIIRCLYLDKKERLWVGTDSGGLNLYDEKNQQFIYYDHDESNGSSLLHNSIQSIFEDRQNILWVGTFAGGVNYYNPYTNAFQSFQSGEINRSVNNNTITGFAEDQSGDLWIATDRGGLNLFNRERNTFRYFRNSKNSSVSISSDIIQHVAQTKDGLWVGHYEKGLDFFNKESERFYHYFPGENNPNDLLGPSVNFIFEDRQDNIWISTSTGLNYINHSLIEKKIPQTLTFQSFQNNPSSIKSLSDNYIKTIFEDNEGGLWFGTWNGLNKLNPKTGTFFNFKNNPDSLSIFTHDYVLCLRQGEQGNFLVGTNENGLLYYIKKTNKIIEFNKQNGFPSNTVVGMEQDNNGLWWISTSNGLIRFDENEQAYSQYNRYDGLPSNEFRPNAHAKLHTGELVFGGNNGFTIFHPDSVKKNLIPPTVFITHFRIFNEPITPTADGILKKEITFTKEIVLPYYQSSIGFDFTGINFTVPQKNQYAYQLEGIDKKWNYVGTVREANYAFVPPGSYTFKVKAANNDGVWTEPMALLIIIEPPWWQTLWFRLASTILVILALVIFYKLRTSQLRRQRKKLEETVVERTKELGQKNIQLSERQEEIIVQKEELQTQRDNLEQQYITIQTLSEIGQEITASIKKEELIFQLYSILKKLMDVSHFSIGYVNWEKQIIEFSTLENPNLLIEDTVVRLDEDRFSVVCVSQKEFIRINDFQQECSHYFKPPHTRYPDGFGSGLYLPLFSMEGNITGVLVVKSIKKNEFTDIHVNTLKNLAAYIGIAFENVRVYKAIQEQSDVLAKQSSKLEALDKLKTRFFLNISHEFRTPLTLIVSPLEQMLSQSQSPDWPRIRRQLEVMNKNAKQLLGLINELLEIRNLESNSSTIASTAELDIVAFIESILNRFEELAKQHQIRLKLNSDLPKILVWFDPDFMQKVLLNLYSNAFKYTPQKGSIETTISVISTLQNDQIMIRICDSGVGIPKNEIPFVFERFYQGGVPINPIQQSSGIGLSLVKDLIHLQAGKIEVESEEGIGTTFIITLPSGNDHLRTSPNNVGTDILSFQSAAPITKSEVSHLNTFRKEKTQILIVEDNPDLREFLRIELETEFSILESSNGKEGVDACIEHIPDLVLSDVMMPVMDGLAMCQVLKSDERTSHIPLILLTAKSGEESHIKGLNIGADDYLAKPFNVKILVARIHNLIASRKKLHVIFSLGRRVKAKEVFENTQDRNFIERIDNFIQTNVKNPEMNHELLTKEIGMSKTQLYRKLQAITGKTVHEYIRNYRLTLAYELLEENPNLLVFEVAYEVGFKDPAYFSKSFFSLFNQWPNDLKKK